MSDNADLPALIAQARRIFPGARWMPGDECPVGLMVRDATSQSGYRYRLLGPYPCRDVETRREFLAVVAADPDDPKAEALWLRYREARDDAAAFRWHWLGASPDLPHPAILWPPTLREAQ